MASEEVKAAIEKHYREEAEPGESYVLNKIYFLFRDFDKSDVRESVFELVESGVLEIQKHDHGGSRRFALKKAAPQPSWDGRTYGGRAAPRIVSSVRMDGRCANLECPNELGQGAFSITTVGEGAIVGGHRGFRLLLCVPCTKALESHVNAG